MSFNVKVKTPWCRIDDTGSDIKMCRMTPRSGVILWINNSEKLENSLNWPRAPLMGQGKDLR